MPTTRTATLPLTPMQEGLLFRHLSEERPGVDVVQIVVSLDHPVSADDLRRAWEAMVERHEAFRVSLRWKDREDPAQVVQEEVEVPFEARDWSELEGKRREARFEAFLDEERDRGFDLERAPLFRLALLSFGPRDHRLVWTFHYVLMDGRSLVRVLRECMALHDALRAGRDLELPPPPTFVGRALTEQVEEPGDGPTAIGSDDRAAAVDDESYWREELSGFGAPTPLPPTGSRPEGKAGTEAHTVRPGEVEARLADDSTADLRRLAQDGGTTLATVARGAWALLLARHAEQDDVVLGETRSCRGKDAPGGADAMGLLVNTIPVRERIPSGGDVSVAEWVEAMGESQRRRRPHQEAPLSEIQAWSELEGGESLFRTLYLYDHAEMHTALREGNEAWEDREIRLVERTGYPLTLYVYGESELLARLAWERDAYGEAGARRLLDRYMTLLERLAEDPGRPVREIGVLPDAERRLVLGDWSAGPERPVPDVCIHEDFRDRARRTPDAAAVTGGGRSLTYAELDRMSDALAARLSERGAGPGRLVGLHADRSPAMVAAVLGILKSGAAFLPLDPGYPESRLRFMLEDSGADLLVASRRRGRELPLRGQEGGTGEPEVVLLEEALAEPVDGTGGWGDDGAGTRTPPEPEDLAYVIYTSGSTGRPKGVMVEHRNVVSFFAAMDERLDPEQAGVWLALTSLSFDISVLELLWTLCRGFEVVLAPETGRTAWASSGDDNASSAAGARTADDGVAGGAEASSLPDVGLFYFASAAGEGDGDPYRLLMEGARFADRNGLSAIWTPERHFHRFGGPYPNPSVAGAAVAAVTERVRIRAGSVVLPLHHPVRVAEEWAVVDNLSGGRAEISFASGWQKDDFVLAPDAYDDRRDVMFDGIDTVRRLWRGEEVTLPGVGGEDVAVRVFPRPVQAELPVWVTAAGSPDTFRRAGEIGAGLLTHLLGQDVDDVAEKIGIYRDAWRAAGHGPTEGRVALMLHTFVGRDDAAVRDAVREPLTEYLRSSASLMRNYAGSWSSYRTGQAAADAEGDELAGLSEEDMEALLEHAFERYYESSGLLGPPDRCRRLLARLAEAGVDEVACLVDFGVAPDLVLDSLPLLAELAEPGGTGAAGHGFTEETGTEKAGAGDRGPGTDAGTGRSAAEASLAELIRRHGVTHLQCTPSQARMLLAETDVRKALAGLDAFLVGGEALPAGLGRRLKEAVGGRVINMYGPTETTVWSSTHDVDRPEKDATETGVVPIGRPVANTRFYVLDEERRPAPAGVPGELYIGGPGVTRGYLGRTELTDERFVPDPFGGEGGGRLYRTGDRVRWRADGVVEFLGRLDRQVKVRGHRIELAEIEYALRSHPDVEEAVVRKVEHAAGDRLVAWLVPAGPDGTPGADEARRFLSRRLPDVMIPSDFLAMESLPRTPNQKIDRASLPLPERTRDGGKRAGREEDPGDYEPPSTVLEKRLAEIWVDVLGLDRVGATDDFFRVGGNSLATLQIAYRIRKAFGVELPLRTFFRASTLRRLARRVEEELLSGADADRLEAMLDEMEDGSQDGDEPRDNVR